MNYRSATVFGTAASVEDPGDKRLALDALVERLSMGRADQVRPPTTAELAGTSVLRIKVEEASAKARSGPPADDADDYALPVWAGVVPLAMTAGEPIADPRLDVAAAAPAIRPLAPG